MFGHQDDSKDDKQLSGGQPLAAITSDTAISNSSGTSDPPGAPLPDLAITTPSVHHGQMLPTPTPSVTSDSDDVSSSEPAVSATPAGDSQDLLGIKQQALQQLSPLVGHLDQSPEEKFRTLMMMIQASDNQSLIKQAYEAADAIGEQKARAQALLDIVNEINYFTHPHEP